MQLIPNVPPIDPKRTDSPPSSSVGSLASGSLAPQDNARLARAFDESRDKLERLIQFRLDRRLRGRIDVEDVIQEAYLAAAVRLEHYPTDGSEYMWLRLIVLQTIHDLHRRHVLAKKRNAHLEVVKRAGGAQSTCLSIVDRLLGHLTSPSQAALRAELSDQLHQAIEQLGEMDAEILALRHFEELSNQEVALALQITEKAASIRYIRALKRLKSVLQQIPDGPMGRG